MKPYIQLFKYTVNSFFKIYGVGIDDDNNDEDNNNNVIRKKNWFRFVIYKFGQVIHIEKKKQEPKY
jgi:hypothetical protein